MYEEKIIKTILFKKVKIDNIRSAIILENILQVEELFLNSIKD